MRAAGVGAVALAGLAAGGGGGAYLAGHRSPTYRVSPKPETQVHPVSCDVVWRAAPAERLAAITFDDGPDPRWTPRVLDLPAAAGARATFFEMGDAVARHPELTAQVARAGHEIASHAIGHRDVTRMTAGELRSDLAATSDRIEQACGERPALFRPPYGRIDAPALFAAAEEGLRVVLWSHNMPGSIAASRWRYNVTKANPGMILLCHDGRSDPNEDLMAAIGHWLSAMRDGGYELVTVSELLAAGSQPTGSQEAGRAR